MQHNKNSQQYTGSKTLQYTDIKKTIMDLHTINNQEQHIEQIFSIFNTVFRAQKLYLIKILDKTISITLNLLITRQPTYSDKITLIVNMVNDGLLPYSSDASKNLPYISSFLRKNLNILQTSQKNTPIQRKKKEKRQIVLSPLQKMVQKNLIQSPCQSVKAHKLLKKSDSTNGIIRQIMNGQTTCLNPQCIQCSQIFIKSMELKNENPSIAKVFGITRDQICDKIFLKQVFTSIGNQGSGVVICGVEPSNRNKVLGFRPNQELKKKFLYSVERILENIFPRLYPIFHEVAVAQYLENSTQASQSGLSVYRLALIPYERNKLHFYQLSAKGFHNIYETYAFRDNYPSLICSSKNKDDLYEMMLSNRENLKTFKNTIHYDFCSVQPIQPQKDFVKNQKNGISDDETDDNSEINLDNDIPVFKYKNKALVVLSSSNKTYIIDGFKQYLENLKILHQIEKPFQNSIQMVTRSVWYFSYDIPTKQMKKVIDRYGKRQMLIMPVQKNLQVNNNRLKAANKFKAYYEAMAEKYPEYQNNFDSLKPIEDKVVNTKQGPMKVQIYSFDSVQTAIFAYIVLENLQIRPYFVKQNQVFISK